MTKYPIVCSVGYFFGEKKMKKVVKYNSIWQKNQKLYDNIADVGEKRIIYK